MKFVIFARAYDENMGGVICLHRLCHLINELGHRCEMVFYSRPIRSGGKFSFSALLDKILCWVKPRNNWVRTDWLIYPRPRLLAKIEPDDVVIYPEIISGNPMMADNVVRWILYHPGCITGEMNYGKYDYIVKFSDAWSCEVLKGFYISNNLLRVVYFPFDLYFNQNVSEGRIGTAYLRRKGKNKPICHPPNSICVDGLSHLEVAAIFKRVKTFISYDAYSAYSWFAAISGVDSIVIPDEGVSLEDWYSDVSDRYGLSYGFDNLTWARDTRSLLFEKLVSEQDKSKHSVSIFIDDVLDYLNKRSGDF